MLPPVNCAESNINTYVPTSQKPWNLQRAMHLYRRTAFGAKPDVVKNSLSQNPQTLVKKIINEAKSLPLTTPPIWANWQINDYSPIEQERNNQIVYQILEWSNTWLVSMRNNGLRDRMSFFWHNHFVTKLEKYGCPSWMYEYHVLLQKYALGNFKEFVREMGKTPAMLVFLDGVQNTRFNPNENYARELYEIFTLGVDNGYNQNDIVETARALSGWNNIDVSNLCGDIGFVQAFWDPGSKTIFGKTGNWGYDDVVNILFAERGNLISEYICRKIYKHFVSPDIDENIVAQLASTFRNSNWELAPVLEQLFLSEHFFDEANYSTIIPGHIEYALTFLNEMGYEDDATLLQYITIGTYEYDQRIFDPTDVSGWPGNRSWITSSSYPFRVDSIHQILIYYYVAQGNSLEHLRSFVFSFINPNENDPAIVSKSIVDYLLPKGLQKQSEYDEALKVFKAEIPENYFESGQWNMYWEYAPGQVYFLLSYLASLPEFQLR